MITSLYKRVDGHPATVEIFALRGSEPYLQVTGDAILHLHPEPPQTGELNFVAPRQNDMLVWEADGYTVKLLFEANQLVVTETGTNPSAGAGVSFAGVFRKAGVVVKW